MKRLSIVGNIKINNVIYSSILQIGDNAVIDTRSRIFAVQREISQFWGHEGNFNEYPIFIQPIPEPPILDSVTMSVDNFGSFIQVGQVHIKSLSTAALMQVGSNRVIESESRIKNIRQFIRPPSSESGPEAAGAEMNGEGAT
jgi:spore germination protein PE